jgi:hypothetical protein
MLVVFGPALLLVIGSIRAMLFVAHPVLRSTSLVGKRPEPASRS